MITFFTQATPHNGNGKLKLIESKIAQKKKKRKTPTEYREFIKNTYKLNTTFLLNEHVTSHNYTCTKRSLTESNVKMN